MSSIDVHSSVIGRIEADFFQALRMTAEFAFNAPRTVVREFERSFAEMPPPARLLALHESPLDVVSDICGLPATDDIQRRYGFVLWAFQTPLLASETEVEDPGRARLRQLLKDAFGTDTDIDQAAIKNLLDRLSRLS